MNNQQQKEQEIITMLQDQKGIKPSEVLLQSILNKLPTESPYQKNTFLKHLSNLQKFSIASVALLMLLVGGIFFNHHSTSPQNSPSVSTSISQSNSSDASLEQDLQSVDAEMSGLNADNTNTDQALNSQSS